MIYTKSGLLPTVQTQGLKICEKKKTVYPLNELLPTPIVLDSKGGVQKVTNKIITRPSRQIFSAGLRNLAENGLLATPILGDWNGQIRKDGATNMLSGKIAFGQLMSELSYKTTGKTSQLNLLFVVEMMGFSVCHTNKLFQKGMPWIKLISYPGVSLRTE